MAGVVPGDTPVVAFQNGIGNEDVIAEHFEHCYGGICRMTCSMLQPGHASFRKIGRLIVGKCPKGTDAVAKRLCAALEEAGFEACVSRNISADRWLKLAVNTQSAFHAVIDPRDHDANEFFELKALTLEETKRIYKAAKVRAKSCDGRDPSIDEMIDDLRRPRARRQSHGMKVHNSTWQDLYLRRATLESPLFHETLLALAREHGVDAPYNETAIAVLRDVHSAGDGPDTLRLSKVLDAVDERKGAP
jgi:ketopantoate reductase